MMSRTTTFGISTLGRCAAALCCGLTLTATGCVGTLGGDDPQASTTAPGAGVDPGGAGVSGGNGGDDKNQLATGSSSGGGSTPPPGAGSPDGTGSMKCTYPAEDGDWAVEVGSTLPRSLHWEGFAEHESTVSTVEIEDYLDCDGSRGIHALLLDTSALWCGSCQQEALMLPGKMASSWAAMGIRVLTLIIQDGQGNPATIANTLAWKNSFRLDPIAVVADPDFTFTPPSGTVALPEMVVVNPRNMQIVAIAEHPQQGDYLLEQFAASNKPR